MARPTTKPRPTPLARRLQKLRGKRSIAEVTALCGVSVASWHKYETGERSPSLGALAKIAGALKTTVPKLLT